MKKAFCWIVAAIALTCIVAADTEACRRGGRGRASGGSSSCCGSGGGQAAFIGGCSGGNCQVQHTFNQLGQPVTQFIFDNGFTETQTGWNNSVPQTLWNNKILPLTPTQNTQPAIGTLYRLCEDGILRRVETAPAMPSPK